MQITIICDYNHDIPARDDKTVGIALLLERPGEPGEHDFYEALHEDEGRHVLCEIIATINRIHPEVITTALSLGN